MCFDFSVSFNCQPRQMQFGNSLDVPSASPAFVLGGAERKPSIQQTSGVCSIPKECQQEKGTFFQKWLWSCTQEVMEGGLLTLLDPLTFQNAVWNETSLGTVFDSKICFWVVSRTWKELAFHRKKSDTRKEHSVPEVPRNQDLERFPAWQKSLRYPELLKLISNSNLKLVFNSILLFSHCHHEIIFLSLELKLAFFFFLVGIISTWPNSKHNSDNEMTFHSNHLSQYLQCLHSDG